jgi:hypothetical protein
MYIRIIFLVFVAFWTGTLLAQTDRPNDSTQSGSFNTAGIFYDYRQKNDEKIKNGHQLTESEFSQAKMKETRKFKSGEDSLRIKNYKMNTKKSATISPREKYIKESN